MADQPLPSSTDRLRLVIKELERNKKLDNEKFPGLRDLLNDVVDPEVEVGPDESLRRLLRVFLNSTDEAYDQVVKQYEPDEERLINEFVKSDRSVDEIGKEFTTRPSIGAREELPVIHQDSEQGTPTNDSVTGLHLHSLQAGNLATEFSEAVGRLWNHKAEVKSLETKESIPDIRLYDDEDCKHLIPMYIDEKWQNWGRTVQSLPALTFVPRTSYGIQQIVLYARQNGMNVRASGYRHSWAPIFSDTTRQQIIISTLGLVESTMLPNIVSLPGSQYLVKHTELNSIDFHKPPEDGKTRLVRVGTAVTNQMLRLWCNSRGIQESCTLPLNVIMVEITLGGSNAPICHGAGRAHPTLSDLVYAIEYVDVKGQLQKINEDENPGFMTAASGCFGLLGIVTHITLKLDPMSYAVMIPRKIPVMQAIPPPPGLKDEMIPRQLRIQMTKEERAKAQAEFEKRARDYYYCEWFWFPFTSKVWVNCWNTTTDGEGSQEYPGTREVFEQFLQTVTIQVLQRSDEMMKLEDKLPWLKTTFISRMGLYAMPDITDAKDAIKTKLPNALHFRRAIQNVRVRDIEMEIPLQPKTGKLKDAKFNDEIDFSSVQQAWWDAILIAYEHRDTYPQRMPLEMRITGPSKVVMSPYRGHNLGTCSIEVLTLEVMKDLWPKYAQKILDKWMGLKDRDGNYLTTRPHWAKEWYNFKVRGQPMVEYLRGTYKEAIVEFRDTLGQISKDQGWDLQEAKDMFSNKTFDSLIFDDGTRK